MSHLPFVAIAPESSRLSDGTLDPDTLRAGDKTATSLNPTSATSNLMAPKSASSASRLPSVVQFPLIVILALGLSASLYSVVPDLAGFELATVSRSVNNEVEIGSLVAWRVFQLGIAWYSGFDYYDYSSFFLLTNAPYYSLLAVFFEVHWFTILVTIAIDLFSNTVPFFLLRSLSPHNRAIELKSPPTPNAYLVSDHSVRLYATIFASAVYGVVVYSSLYTWLPVYLITNFDSIRTLEYAHNASLPVLLLGFVPLGYAAKDFLFTSSIASARSEFDYKEFDPESASLAETLAWNVGLSGWGPREDVLLKRTALLVSMTLATSLAKIYGTVEGAEQWGALGWGGVFASASLLTGVGFAWVGDV